MRFSSFIFAAARSPRYFNTMTLHLIKLCVGAESIADLERYREERIAAHKRLGIAVESLHTTRMMPTRAKELLDGGSLYWIIKGQVAARQRLTAIRQFTGGDGIKRCDLVMDTKIVHVRPRPFRPFQGWRYLAEKDAPPDMGAIADTGDMPEALRRELAGLGLL